jgi:FixJ family two-component response regulator
MENSGPGVTVHVVDDDVSLRTALARLLSWTALQGAVCESATSFKCTTHSGNSLNVNAFLGCYGLVYKGML